MRRLLAVIGFLLCAVPASAQTMTRTHSFTATGSDNEMNQIGKGVVRHKIQWYGVGTVSTCSVKLEQSVDNVTYTDLIAAQTCTANGVARTVTDSSPPYVRITLSTLSGGGSLTVRYDGYDAVVTASAATSPTDQTTISLSDEFIGGSLSSLSVGDLLWTMSGSAACGTAVETAGALPNVGLFTVTTGASSGNTCGLTGASASTLGALGNSAPWEMVWVFKVPSNATAGAYLGFSDSLTAVPTNWAGFKYDTSGDATFHLCVGATCDSTAPTADTNFHRLRMWSNVAATINMQYDTNAPVSFCAAGCTNAVTPTTNVVTPIAQAVTRTAGAKTLTVDYFGFKMAGLSR